MAFLGASTWGQLKYDINIAYFAKCVLSISSPCCQGYVNMSNNVIKNL